MKKEKRYFCDVISKLIHNKFVVCILLVLTLLFATYWHLYYNPKICDKNFEDYYTEIKEQSNFLISIKENTIIEGECIDINAIPEDVSFRISSNGDTITYYYSIDSSSTYNKTFTLSKDYKILNEDSGFTLLEEEDYRKTFKFNNYLTSFVYGFITLFIIIIGGSMLLFIPYMFSSIRKYSNSTNQ